MEKLLISIYFIPDPHDYYIMYTLQLRIKTSTDLRILRSSAEKITVIEKLQSPSVFKILALYRWFQS